MPDGSRLTWLNAPSGKKEDRLPVRAAEHNVILPSGDGTEEASETCTVITTLLDHQAAPAGQARETYLTRWSASETTFGEDKSTITGAGIRTSGPVLRSGSPRLVIQVLAAALSAHRSAAFDVRARVPCRSSGCGAAEVAAGSGFAVVVAAEEAGEHVDEVEQQRIGLGLLVGGELGAVAGDELVPPGGCLLFVPGGLAPSLAAGLPPAQCLARVMARPGGWCWSVSGEFGDCFLGAGIVDEVLAGGGGGDERGGGGVVEGAGQAGGDAVQPGDGVVGDRGSSRPARVMWWRR